MKKYIFICLINLPLLCFSQPYRSALGVKLCYPGQVALNMKIFGRETPNNTLLKHFALDNSLGINFNKEHRYIALQSLVEFNQKLGVNEGYNWYAGLGPAFNYYVNGGYLQNDGTDLTDKLYIKCDGVFGAEYTRPRTRFNVAMEAGPSVMLVPIVKFGFFLNVAVRYTFKKRV